MKTKSHLSVLSFLLASVLTILVCEISAQSRQRADWNLQNSGTTVNLNAVDFISPLNGVVVGDAGKILKTTD